MADEDGTGQVPYFGIKADEIGELARFPGGGSFWSTARAPAIFVKLSRAPLHQDFSADLPGTAGVQGRAALGGRGMYVISGLDGTGISGRLRSRQRGARAGRRAALRSSARSGGRRLRRSAGPS